MQYDMHYYGTFAMAYAAGLEVDHAAVVATAAQFVDDNNLTQLRTLPSQEGALGVATAHHPLEAGERAKRLFEKEDDSRLIWVPFHFLPGNEGQTFEERLVCVKNSALAQALVAYYSSEETVNLHREHALHLIGIAAHVYADTFSHYGFCGIPSALNDIDVDTIEVDAGHSSGIRAYLAKRLGDFKEGFIAKVAAQAHLGHGAVATYPDRPYLRWSYVDSRGNEVQRDNPVTFMEACENLHSLFSSFRESFYSGSRGQAVTFEQIREPVAQVLATEADAAGRVAAWISALAAGKLGPKCAVPVYSSTQWLDELLASRALRVDPKTKEVDSHAYRYYAAADYHRNYVLKRLLPNAGLFVA